ncbi:benzoate/H(+) symporter BenE family transporter [Rhodococcus sp. NBC_00294]|uniref:benzoate/H(+) symporter BenE family transporter n=1 Tax=Rhodococcus sp. NBC_00294 TaxID=2976004 RepID=UPI002E29744D|nr:benzoate/H(+) symporter BenE family transporter [Rhodococcus sp. NBC_00294]
MTETDDRSSFDSGDIASPRRRPPGLRALKRSCSTETVGAGATGVLFSATGPVAVILGAASVGGLTSTQTASWIFGVFVLNGVLTLVVSWVYRMPLAFFWTIPGTVLVGQSLTNLAWPEVVGAYVVTGVLIVALGSTGLVAAVMRLLPVPIVMAMVAGAFLSFGTELVRSVTADVSIAGTMVVAWVIVSSSARWRPRIPPVLVSLLAGLSALVITDGFSPDAASGLPMVGLPEFVVPVFTWQACGQLVIPLAITVIAVQNGQGAAVLRAAGHRPPITVITVLSGVWSVLVAPLGAVSTCLAGPTNALLTAVGRREHQYIAGMVCGALAVVVGLSAPALVRGLVSVPHTFVAALAGLAMLEALRGAFVAAFGEPADQAESARPALAPLVTLLVTVSGVQVAGLGAPFWALICGVVTALVLDGTAGKRRQPD